MMGAIKMMPTREHSDMSQGTRLRLEELTYEAAERAEQKKIRIKEAHHLESEKQRLINNLTNKEKHMTPSQIAAEMERTIDQAIAMHAMDKPYDNGWHIRLSSRYKALDRLYKKSKGHKYMPGEFEYDSVKRRYLPKKDANAGARVRT